MQVSIPHPSPLRAAAVGLLLAAAAACGDDPARERGGAALQADPPARRIHLLNLPAAQVASDGHDALDLQAPADGEPVRARRLGDDHRRAFRFGPAEVLTFRGLPQGAARLTFGLSVEADEALAGPPPELRVLVGEDAGAPAWSQALVGAEGEPAWEEVAIDLGRVDGSVAFRIENFPGAGRLRVFLGSPVVEYPDLAIEPVDDPPPCVVVFLIDTLRADHLGLYGHDAPTSARIEAVARESLVFEDASATASWTKASVASLLTGRYPSLIRVEDYTDQLPASELLVSDALREAGYRTAAFGFNTWIFNPKYGFAPRFDEFFEVVDRTTPRETRSDAVVDEALDWLTRNPDEPFFLYVHTIDPHAPYLPLPESQAPFLDAAYEGPVDEWVALARTVGREPLRRDQLDDDDLRHARDLYDAEIAFNDAQVGLLVDRLKALGLWEECLFVLTSDHGEGFLEHGQWSHGGSLFQEQIHVPLVIKPPRSSGLEPGRIATPVSLVDVVPTILQLQRVREHSMDLLGQSLAELAVRESLWKRRFVLSELDRENTEMTAVRMGRWKYVHQLGPQERELLFDLEDDPGETRDLLDAPPEAARVPLEQMRRTLAVHRALERSAGVYVDVDGAGVERSLELLVRTQGAPPSVRFFAKGEGDGVEFGGGDGGATTATIRVRTDADGAPERLLIEPASSEAELTLLVLVDGQPAGNAVVLGPDRVPHEGGERLGVRMDDKRLHVEALPAPAAASEASIHVYVLPREQLELDEGEIDELRKLGYFGGDGND